MTPCTYCGFANREGARFCQGCGAQLAAAPAPAPPEEQPAPGRLVAGFATADTPANQGSLTTLVFAPHWAGRAAPALACCALAAGLGEAAPAAAVGPAQAGQVALQSFMAHVSCQVLLAELAGEGYLPETLAVLLTEGLEEAHARLQALATHSGQNLGAALTALLVRGRDAVIAHVGHSRVYHVRGQTLTQLTTDHSIAARLLALGQLTPEEALAHPQQDALYHSLGGAASMESDIVHLELQPGDWVLLCSPGVWRRIPKTELGAFLATAETPQSLCDYVIAHIMSNQGVDGGSIVALHLT